MCTPPESLDDSATSSTAAAPPAATPPAAPGRTRSMPRHSIAEGFLAEFVTHLQSLAGGKKTEALACEIAVDVAKYLYFANAEAVQPASLVRRALLTQFVSTLEGMGIGTSGIRTKLVRLRLAIQFYALTREGEEDEDLVGRKVEQTKQLLETMRGCVAIERAREECSRLEDFQPPSLDGVAEFLSSTQLSVKIAVLNSRMHSGGQVSDGELEEAQLILVGRVMYRYVQHPSTYTYTYMYVYVYVYV